MDIKHYTPEQVTQLSVEQLHEHLDSGQGVVWIDINLMLEPEAAREALHLMRHTFHFHELTIEDVVYQEQRPKVEEFVEYLFIILNPVHFRHNEIFKRELDVFVGKNYLLTVHNGPEALIREAQVRIVPGRMAFAVSTTYLLYILLDTLIDAYLPILETLEDSLDKLEAAVLKSPNQKMQLQLFEIKQCLNALWWVVWPQKDIMSLLGHHHLVFTDERSQYFLRDVTDHLQRITTSLQSARESVTGLTNLYVSAVSIQLNLAVNRLTIFAMIIGVLTVVSGFYGMNFEHNWPPFESEWGVPFVIGLMIVTSLLFYLFLRRRAEISG